MESGPLFLDYRTGGSRPAAAEDLEITARFGGNRGDSILSDWFGSESSIAMTGRDGENFSAIIPGGLVAN